MTRDHVSVTKKDLKITAIRGSGPGGQHRNKVATGVRMEHPASGAVVEATEHKSQLRNQGAALEKLARNPTFKGWIQTQMARPSDFLVEVQIKSPDGKSWWVPAPADLAITETELRSDGGS